mgnify:CR=1 FL=1
MPDFALPTRPPPLDVPCESKVSVDIAQLCDKLDEASVQEEAHIIKITNRVPISVSQFKEMFYATGNGQFSVSNPYPCVSPTWIKSSVWGVGTQNYVTLTFSQSQLGAWDVGTIVTDCSTCAMGYTTNVGNGSTTTQMTLNIIWGTFTLNSTNLWWTNTSGEMFNLSPAVTITAITGGPAADIWYNFNRLGGRNNNPGLIQMPYVYENDVTRTFYPQIDIMNNIEQDMCLSRENWTLCSRSQVWDSLFNLAFAPERFNYLCLNICCGRSWREVVDAILDEAANKNIILKSCDFIDVVLEIKITSCHKCVKPNIIKVKFRLLITDIGTDFEIDECPITYVTEGPTKLHNVWVEKPMHNTHTSAAASGVISSGVVGDAPEGGNQQSEGTSVVVN